MSVITFYQLACRVNRSRWPVHLHALYNFDGKFENVLATKIVILYFCYFWFRRMVSLSISIIMELHITSESNLEG